MPFVLYEALQNLLTKSEEFNHADWLKIRSSISGNVIAAPDGTISVDLLVEDTSVSDSHYAYQTATVVSGKPYTFSLYVKPAGRTQIRLQFGVSGPFADFDLSLVTILSEGPGLTGSIIDAGNGFYRISVTGDSGATSENCYAILLKDGADSYTGDGLSSLYIWGAQLNEGGINPYIRTLSSVLTDDAIFVNVYPEFNLKDSGKKVESRHRARDGSEYVYKWGDFDLIDAPVEFVSRSFKSQVNSWFGANTDLIWMENHVFDISSVHIVNKSKPIDKLNKPYVDQYKGKIQLGTY